MAALVAYLFALLLSIAVVGITAYPGHLEPPNRLWTVVLAVAFSLTRLVSTRLPRGDEVRIDEMVGLSALWLTNIETILMSSILSGLVDVFVPRESGARSPLGERLLGTVRRIAVISLVYPAVILSRGETGERLLFGVLAAGVLYVALDVFAVSTQQRILVPSDGPRGVVSVFRPLASIYLVHIAMAAVVVRVSSSLGVGAFLIALLMTLILQNGLNLYLRIRRAYAETIEVLAQAAELDRPADAGHARRVADLSIAVGRRLGMAGVGLEQLGYAALLHDLGRIGHAEADFGGEHAVRGARIVESIPFLSPVAPLIADHHCVDETDNPTPATGAIVVGVCSDFDRLRSKHGSTIALQRMVASEGGQVRRRVIGELIRVIAATEVRS
ncbi:MAG: HD domain-containing protein [Coriobacteriia bacterium]